MTPGAEDELPPPTAPPDFPVRSFGFADSASADLFEAILREAVTLISRAIDLDRLDGITVAHDYGQALATLDRGYSSSTALTHTRTTELVGVAMTPTVLRDGVIKAHIVFNAANILALQNTENEYFSLAFALVAHECAHVAELKHRDIAFPGVILQAEIPDYVDVLLGQYVEACWTEYAACRMSARFGRVLTPIYEEMLGSVLPTARASAITAKRAYQMHADILRLLAETSAAVWHPLRTAAYLFGHLDGLNATLDEAPNIREQLRQSRFEPFATRLHEALRLIWSRWDVWASLSEFDPLKRIGMDVLTAGGVVISRLSDGRARFDFGPLAV